MFLDLDQEQDSRIDQQLEWTSTCSAGGAVAEGCSACMQDNQEGR